MSDQYAHENINDLQINLINMRRKYSKTILKTDRQCNKIELKIMERIKLICDDSANTEQKSPPPPSSSNSNNFTMDEKLLKQFNNQDIENKQMIHKLKYKLKNLDYNVTRVSRVVNCEIYKEIFEK